MEMKLALVEKFGYRCVTFRDEKTEKTTDGVLDFSGRTFIFQENKAFQCQRFYQSKQSRYQMFGPGYSLKWIFPLIRLLYDQNGILIARRTGPGQSLRLTGKGITKQLVLANSISERQVCCSCQFTS